MGRVRLYKCFLPKGYISRSRSAIDPAFELYLIYNWTWSARPLFTVPQTLCYEALLSRCDIIEDVSQDIKTYPAV